MGISVDPAERNAAMVDKLALPYPLLSDPDGQEAIKPYGVWHDGQSFARPAVVLLRPDGSEAVRQVGEDFADRLPEEELVEANRADNLPAARNHPPHREPRDPDRRGRPGLAALVLPGSEDGRGRPGGTGGRGTRRRPPHAP